MLVRNVFLCGKLAKKPMWAIEKAVAVVCSRLRRFRLFRYFMQV